MFDAGDGNDTISDYDALDIIRMNNGASSIDDFTFTDTVEGLLLEYGADSIFFEGLDRIDLDASDFSGTGSG